MQLRSPERSLGIDMDLGDDDWKCVADVRVRTSWQLSDIAERFCRCFAPHVPPTKIASLHLTVVDWISSVLAGPDDDPVAAKRRRVVDECAALQISLPTMLAATCSLRRSLGDLVADLYPADESRRVIGCVEKLLDRELAAMVASQLRSYDDRLVAQERGSLAARVSAIQTLSTGFAHELRNPVNAARLQLELLERQLHRTGDRDPKLAHAIEAIEHELERLARLLTEFLSFAKPGELALGSHDVREVVRAAVASEQAFAVAGNVTLEQGGHETVEARIDANKLQQAIQNLVRNAIEACPPGGHVTVIVRGDDQQVHIDVDDDGPGIPDAIQRRIYEPFFTTKQTGTGLGLSIVHSIVTLHGGAVEIHSSPRGSRFEIVLPRRT